MNKSLDSNWYVLTGAPSSGKTTTLAILAEQGFQIIPEAARVFIDQEIAKGRTIEEIRRDELLFQRQVFEMKVTTERQLHLTQKSFFDRGLHDSLAYYRLYNYPISDSMLASLQNPLYKKVFLLETLDFEEDYARTENAAMARTLEDLLEAAYLEYGLPVIRVPKTTLQKRVKIILTNL